MNKSRLEHLLKTHHQDAFRWASQCCGYQDEHAKEVLQKVYLKILEGKAKYHEKSSFKTWLFSVIRFTAIDYLKSNRTFKRLETLEQIPSIEVETEKPTMNYQKLLAQLPKRQHQVLLLAFYHNLTLAEIAEVTHLHIGTVRTHYERGKSALKKLILKEKYGQYR